MQWWTRYLLCFLVILTFLSIYFLGTSPLVGTPTKVTHPFFRRVTGSLEPVRTRQQATVDGAPTRHSRRKTVFRSTKIPESLNIPKAPTVERPTDPPYIGDIYAQEDSFPQRTCPDSIRQKIAGTVIGPRFLDRVPVLQWHKHLSPEEFRRLQQYPGAHGWGEVDYQTLAASLSLLNTRANELMFDDWERQANGSTCIRCAVVGNGGILRGAKVGREIDQHHYVFRTNAAVIQGFQEDVGSRTSIYTFSTNTMLNSIQATADYKGPPQSEETRYVFLPDHDRDYLLVRAAVTHTPVERGEDRGERASTYFGSNVTARKLKMYHPDFIRYLRNRFLHSKILDTTYHDLYRPSTGAVMLLAALHTCDQVSAYGFLTPDYQKYSDHYYDQTYHLVEFYSNHDYAMELELWQELHRAGLIRLYMGPRTPGTSREEAESR